MFSFIGSLRSRIATSGAGRSIRFTRQGTIVGLTPWSESSFSSITRSVSGFAWQSSAKPIARCSSGRYVGWTLPKSTRPSTIRPRQVRQTPVRQLYGMFQPAASPAFKTHWPSGTSNECPLGVKVTLNGIASLPSLQCALVASSHGIDDRVRDQLAVEHRDLLAELEAPRVAHEPVEVAPAVEDLGRLVLPRSDHEVVRLRGDRVGVDPDDLQAAHEMTLVVRLVEQRLRDAVDAVLEHALALERESAERELADEIHARLHLVNEL